MIGEYNNETNFPHKLLLTDRHVSKFHKTFANNSSVDIKLSKTQISKRAQSREFLQCSNFSYKSCWQYQCRCRSLKTSFTSALPQQSFS